MTCSESHAVTGGAGSTAGSELPCAPRGYSCMEVLFYKGAQVYFSKCLCLSPGATCLRHPDAQALSSFGYTGVALPSTGAHTHAYSHSYNHAQTHTTLTHTHTHTYTHTHMPAHLHTHTHSKAHTAPQGSQVISRVEHHGRIRRDWLLIIISLFQKRPAPTRNSGGQMTSEPCSQ